jgi:glycosyltransferase involved in cell wall biosynthesis
MIDEGTGILVLTPGMGGRDGVSRLSRELVSTLAELAPSSEVSVWSLADCEAPSGLPGGVSFRAASGGRHRIAAWAVAESLRGQRGRIVLVLHAHLAPLALPLIARGASLAQFLVGIEVWKPLTVLQRQAISRAKPVVGISDHTVRRFRCANPGFDVIPTLVCHPGMPSEESRREDVRRRDAALIVGRMVSSERYKGHDELLEIWPSVLSQIGPAELWIAGDGDDRARLEAKAASLGLSDQVKFLGELSEAELRNLYFECSFFVMPSRDEGFGLVFLEAMRCAKACIGAAGAAAEIITDGESGYVVDPGDGGALTEAVVRLFRDEELRKRMGKRGLARFQEHFTVQHFQRRLGHVLDAMKER